MEYRRLGNTGLHLSALSLGSWVTFGRQIDLDRVTDLMRTAYENGVNFFDGAEAYERGQAEVLIGRALQEFGWPRDSYCLSSKVLFGAYDEPLPTQQGLSRKHVFEACEQSLQRYGQDYLDLYFCHRHDPRTPVAEVVRAMNDLIAMGKVLYWGTSQWPVEALKEAFQIAAVHHLVPPVAEQCQYNLLERSNLESVYLPFIEEQQLGTTTWSPLKSGFLTGKYARGLPAGTRATLPGFEWLRDLAQGEQGRQAREFVAGMGKIAAELGATPAALAIAWCLKNEHVSTVVTGATQVAQLEENLTALDLVSRLDDEVMDRMKSLVC